MRWLNTDFVRRGNKAALRREKRLSGMRPLTIEPLEQRTLLAVVVPAGDGLRRQQPQ